MQRGGPRCKNHSCFHAFGRHAQRRADMQGWPPEMQKKISHPCMSASYYHVLQPNIVFASRTATLACRPCYSTVLLFYYFTPDTVLPRPMFGVGRPRCKNKFAFRTATLACRPAYYFTILLLHSRYSTAAADVWGWPPEMQKQVFAARTATLACRPS